MIRYKDNWEDAKKHYEAYWEQSSTDRCCLAISTARVGGKELFPNRPATPEEAYTDPQRMHEGMMNGCERTEYLYECIPSRILDFGVAGECQYFGSVPNYTPGTIWFEPILDEPDADLLKYDRSRFEFHKKITQDLVDLAGDNYFVGMNDNCGIIDALAHLRGTENLLLDMITEPEFVHAARDKITEVWKATQQEIFDVVKENNLGGSSHSWMQLWAPGRHLQLQCDYSCMISPKMFEEFVLPELEETSSAFDYCTYHLDGVEQLRHLDMILSVKGINNIQWTRVAGQPKTSENIEALQKIQKAGKGLVLFPERDEVEFLMRNLSHKGLQICYGGVKDREEAEDVVKLAKSLCH